MFSYGCLAPSFYLRSCWLAFGDSFRTWVDKEILFAGFVIWILEIIINIKICVLCEKIHKTSIVFQIIV